MIHERVFKTRHFARWMRKTELLDDMLCNAIAEMTAGLIDADLGHNVIKKRIALPGQGKRGGVRAIVATCKSGNWFFLYGFEKNQRANITAIELTALQSLASTLLDLNATQLSMSTQEGALEEICHDH